MRNEPKTSLEKPLSRSLSISLSLVNFSSSLAALNRSARPKREMSTTTSAHLAILATDGVETGTKNGAHAFKFKLGVQQERAERGG